MVNEYAVDVHPILLSLRYLPKEFYGHDRIISSVLHMESGPEVTDEVEWPDMASATVT